MIIKKHFLLFIFCLSFFRSDAQTDDFCDAVSAILRDAPNRFRNIKGNETSASNTAMTWECGIKVPGTVASRFVLSNGLFYEGAVFQTANKSEIRAVYDKYKEMLDKCLLSQGYKLTLQDNFYAGLGDYKKLAYMPQLPADAKPQNSPGHVTMEVTFSKDIGKYTVVAYIFEH